MQGMDDPVYRFYPETKTPLPAKVKKKNKIA